MHHCQLGRFCSRDPVEYESEVNLFEYVWDCPTTRTDPLGMQAWPITSWPIHEPPRPTCSIVLYDGNDRKSLQAWATAAGAELALCTRKDLVKLQMVRLGITALWAVAIELQFLRGRQELESLLEERISKPR